MTILSRWARDALERLLGRFHEGPDPPPRVAQEPRLFRAMAPEAPTEEEWEEWAVAYGDRCYRAGFVRGMHWLERSWDGPAVDPERVLEMEAHEADRIPEEMLRNPRSAREVREFHDAIHRAAAAGIDVHIERPPRR